MNNKVSFFIVGNQKSGTTTFHNLLKLHPEIFLPEYKELKFFCTDLQRESDKNFGKERHFNIRTIEQYSQNYCKARRGQICGEVTPHYTFSREAAKNIFDYNSDAKIIIFLREPASFIESLHSELLNRLVENEKDLFKALSLEEDRKKGINLPPKIYCPSYLHYSRWVDYSVQVKRYVNLFGRDKVKIFFLEQIASDERFVLKEVLRFIGVKNTDFYPEIKIFRNARKSIRFEKLWGTLKNSKLWIIVKKMVLLKH